MAVAAHIYAPTVAPQDSTSLKIEGSIIHITSSSKTNTAPRDHALERREARVARFPPRRHRFLLGLLRIGLGLRRGAGTHRARADRAARLYYWSTPADRLPTSQNAF